MAINPGLARAVPSARIPLSLHGYPGFLPGPHSLARRMPLSSGMKTTEDRLGGGRGMGGRGRVLIVEDDPAMCQTIHRALRSHGYQTEGVADGEQAMARVQHEDFVAVVADLGLTRNHDVDLLREMRRMDGFLQAVIYIGIPVPSPQEPSEPTGVFCVLIKSGSVGGLAWPVEEACRAVFQGWWKRCA
jgi:hypothetical protein